MTDFTPSPELVEAAAAAFPTYGTDEDCVLECLSAAVAYRNKNGDPELVPYAQVRTLREFVQSSPCECHLPEYPDRRCDRCAAHNARVAATANDAALALSILIKMFNDDDGYIHIYGRGWTWDGYTDTLTPTEVDLLRRLGAARRDEEGSPL